MPAQLVLVRLLLAVEQWLHSLVIGRIRLDQVDNIELVNVVSFGVAHPEEVPLRHVLNGAVVLFKLQIVLKLSNLACSVQVARLKS